MKGDITIVGSGISGSILALVLRQIGYRVRLVDRQSHPRFSIGESSTPYADLVLRALAKRYGLSDLHNLSRYGLWREHIPHLEGGPKRGFVYYPQLNPQKSADNTWNGEIVVASSRNRHLGDSNWVRSSLDRHLHQLCLESDIECCDHFDLVAADRRKDMWTLRFQLPTGETSECRTEFLIDATSNGSLANLLFGYASEQHGFRTNTSAIFTHVHPLPEFRDILNDNGFETKQYPFPPDDSAMHHLTNEGWFWALRFDNGRTSIGQLSDLNEVASPVKPDSLEAWIQSAGFPSLLGKQMKSATLHTEPGQIIQTGRLQRRLTRAVAPGWLALPSTYGFVDPMHSTGIAWSLHGVEWIARQFEQGIPGSTVLMRYEENLSRELDALDRIISVAYHSRRDPDRFELSVMLYFVATVAAEQHRILKPDQLQGFLQTNNDPLWERIRTSVAELKKVSGSNRSLDQRQEWFKLLNNRFREWNNVGLFDSSVRGIYRHTAPDIIE